MASGFHQPGRTGRNAGSPSNVTNSTRIRIAIARRQPVPFVADAIALALEKQHRSGNPALRGRRWPITTCCAPRARGIRRPVATSVFTPPPASPARVLRRPPDYVTAGATQIGIAPANFDPTLTGALGLAHNTTPTSQLVHHRYQRADPAPGDFVSRRPAEPGERHTG